MNIVTPDDVERWIDRVGLTSAIEVIAIICDEKAEHLRAMWQDQVAAGSWSRTSAELDKLAARVKARGL